MVAARLKPIYEKEAKERQQQSGGDRKSLEYQESLSANLQKPIELEAPIHSHVKAATVLNVSPRSVESASAVITKADPTVTAAVDSGKLAVSTAAIYLYSYNSPHDVTWQQQLAATRLLLKNGWLALLKKKLLRKLDALSKPYRTLSQNVQKVKLFRNWTFLQTTKNPTSILLSMTSGSLRKKLILVSILGIRRRRQHRHINKTCPNLAVYCARF